MRTVMLADGSQVMVYLERSREGFVLVTLVPDGENIYRADRHKYYGDPAIALDVFGKLDVAQLTARKERSTSRLDATTETLPDGTTRIE
jgi:hypothetical protein